MVSSSRQAVTCFLLILSSTLYAHSQTTTPPAKTSTASISGKVTIKGKAAAGIVVGVRLLESHNPQASRHRAVTDDQGNYKIQNIPPGQYQVVAVAPVYISDDYGRGRTILLNKDETIENVDISLVRGGVITGKVTDSEGRPVIEEGISLHSVAMSKGVYFGHMNVRTDDRGIYRIYGLPPGKYRVGAGVNDGFTRSQRALYKLTFHPDTADMNQATVIEVTEGSETKNVDITLGRAIAKYSAQGRIVDGRTGQPVPNVRYGVSYFMGEHGRGSMTTGAVSNTEGEFKLDDLSPGKYAVYFEVSPQDDFRAEPVRFEVIDQDITGLIARTSKGATVSGVVVLEGTHDKSVLDKLRNIHVFAGVVEEQMPAGDAQSSAIEQDGGFRVRALKGGLLAFSISGQGRFQISRIERDGIVYPKGIRINDGEQVSGVRIILNYGSGTVRGIFKLEGGTLPQNAVMGVTLRRLGEEQDSLNSIAGSAQVDARGQFFMEGLIPGTYEMTAAVYIVSARSATPIRSTKQQVVVTDGGVTNVMVTLNLDSPPDRP
jgi:Carboxypeptidase regulatory-like domain